MTQSPIEWLKSERRLDGDLLAAMGVQERDHPGLGLAVAFPYRRDGKTYAAKFRTVDKRFSSSSGVTRGVYNEEDLGRLSGLPVVITEGEIDALSVMQAGWERAISVPDGWTEKGNKIDALAEVEEKLRQSPYVLVAGDSDKAGESLPRAVAQLLRGHDVRFAKWPADCKDPNDVLVRHGEGALAEALGQAQRIDPPGGMITGISDLPPIGSRRVLRISDEPFRYVVALEVGGISVWTGIPGSGKSTFLIWAMGRVTKEERVRAGMLCFETHPHTIRDQLALMTLGLEFGQLSRDERASLEADLDQRVRLVHATLDGDGHHLKWLEDMIYALAVRDRCKVVVIDPWNELEHMPMPGESLTQYTNYAIKHIRGLAKSLDIHICIVAHPRKINSDSEKIRAPNGYDVADSAAFYNKPDLGVTIHQEKDEHDNRFVSLRVWKVRNTRLYKFQTGKVDADFDPSTMVYRKRMGVA